MLPLLVCLIKVVKHPNFIALRAADVPYEGTSQYSLSQCAAAFAKLSGNGLSTFSLGAIRNEMGHLAFSTGRFPSNVPSLSSAVSRQPTDFAQWGGWYFTHQLWVALHYSKLINQMCPVADRRTVELHLPLVHFDEVKTWDVKGDDLKKLLFFSRNVDLKYPKDISRQKAKPGVIQGPIAHCHTIAFEKMSHWTEVTDAHLLKEKDEEFGGTKWAKQLVWMTDESIKKLEVAFVGKAYMRLPEKKFKLIPEPWKDVQSLCFPACSSAALRNWAET